MDLYSIIAIVMLVAWAVITFATEAPGVVHLLLTAGVTLLIWRIVRRDTTRADTTGSGTTGATGASGAPKTDTRKR